MPEHDPQVGQACSSIRVRSLSDTDSEAESAITLTRLRPVRTVPSTRVAVPPSMGPPDTNTVGTSRRRAAISMPGVILSQLEMHTRASAWWALNMYSIESALRSRAGSELNLPEWPLAVPPSGALVYASPRVAP